jgi:hypothetical protein
VFYPLLHAGLWVLRTSTILSILVATQSALGEPLNRERNTTNSFMFLWPGQDESARQLSLTAPIVTDRPSFTASSRTVGAGVTQAELGYTYFYGGSDTPHQQAHTYPELALRQGMFQDWLELRLSQSLTSTDVTGSSSTGFDDLETGLRFGITPTSGWLPELSISPQLSLPTGSADLRAHQILLGVVVSYSWTISESSSLAGSTQGVQEETSEGNELYGEWTQSIIASSSVSSDLSLWVECFGIFPASRSGRPDTYYVNTGTSYLLNSNMQIDLRIGSRLDDNFGEDIFSGLGFSVRYL